MTTRRISYRPELDGIRAIAILGVLVFHIQLMWFTHLRGDSGLLGVDLFFVLSGFLITSLLLDEHATTRTFSKSRFYGRRALRLLPALMLALLLGAFVTHLYGNGNGALPYRRAAFASLFFSGNWFGDKLGVLTPTWSLGLEEQYYLLWPLGLALALRRGVRTTRLALFTAALAGSFAAMRSALDHGVFSHASWVVVARGWSRADGVLIGTTLALVLTRDRHPVVDRILRDRGLMAASLVCVCGVSVRAAFANRATWDWILLLDCCFALLIGHVFLDARTPLSHLLRTPPLPSIGRISYGIYVFHWPIFFWARHAIPNRLTAAGAALVGTLCLAGLSFNLIERPALHLKARLARPRSTRNKTRERPRPPEPTLVAVAQRAAA